MKLERELLLKEAPVKKAVTSLAVPAIIGMMVNAIYNIVDTFFVGMLNDTAALGGTTVLFPVFLLISSVGLTFGMGAGSVISRRLGEQKKDDASRVASTAFFSALIIGIIFTIFGTLFVKPLLLLFGATASILDQAQIYGSIIIGGSVFQMLNMTMNNMLRAEGAAKISGTALALGAVLNIILDPIYMFALDMGLAGAGAATITGQCVSTIFLSSYYIRKKTIVKISGKRFSPSKEMYRQIMTIGVPTFFRQALGSFAMGMLTNASAPFGDSAIAAAGITFRIIMMPMMVLFGFCQGFQPLAGYAYGAENYTRLRKSVKFSVKWATGFAFLSAVILFSSAELIIGVFTRDPEVLQRGILSMRLNVIIMPFMGVQLIYSFLFQALGHGKPTLLLAVARQGIFFVPAVLILPKLLGLSGVYLAQPTADALTVAVSLILAVRINRNLNELEADQVNTEKTASPLIEN